MNTVILSGNVTRDFEPFTTKTGTTIAKSSIATEVGFGDNKKTSYPAITVFGKTADFCSQFVKKGDLIEVRGHLETGSYKKSDGTTVYTTDVIVEELKKLRSRREDAIADVKPLEYTMPEVPYEALEEDIPF